MCRRNRLRNRDNSERPLTHMASNGYEFIAVLDICVQILPIYLSREMKPSPLTAALTPLRPSQNESLTGGTTACVQSGAA